MLLYSFLFITKIEESQNHLQLLHLFWFLAFILQLPRISTPTLIPSFEMINSENASC